MVKIVQLWIPPCHLPIDSFEIYFKCVVVWCGRL